MESLINSVEVFINGVQVQSTTQYNTISKILGYSLGVAITGTENTTTLILTEGFGEVNMAKRTFDLLKENELDEESINEYDDVNPSKTIH